MASVHDFFISGDHEQGKHRVAEALQAQGFTIESTPNGGFVVKRGNMTKTIWLGAFAGKDFQVTFIVEFFVDDKGLLVARLNRDLGSGLLKGGAIGASKTSDAFNETVHGVGTALSAAGVYVSSVAVG